MRFLIWYSGIKKTRIKNKYVKTTNLEILENSLNNTIN